MKRQSSSIFGPMILLICLFSYQSKAQLSASDSVYFINHFTEYLYNDPIMYPGNWYVYDSVVSMNDLEVKLNEIFKFQSSDFLHAEEDIELDTEFYYDVLLNPTFNTYYTLYGNAYKQYDPLVKLDFTLNGKSTSAYSTYSTSTLNTDHEIAFLMIPGSNQNQTSELMLGTGYHNTNCYVRDELLNFGDVFILCKPLEDYRALRWNGFKLNSSDYNTPVLNDVYNYLDSIDHPYGTNYLIDVIAMIKQMKKDYKKVVLVGCSLGGYSALLASMNIEVDACIVASGYTMNIDNDTNFINELKQNFKDLPNFYTNTLVKNTLQQSVTNYLFSWPDYDSYWYQLEHNDHYTESFFAGLDNCTYFYDYNYHSFPPCYTMDTFLQKVMNKPKLFFKVTDSTNKDSLKTQIDFMGRGPFNFQLHKNGNLYKSYAAISNPVDEVLTDSGMYTIDQIQNVYQLKGTCNDSVLFKRINPASSNDVEANRRRFMVQNPFSESLAITAKSTWVNDFRASVTISTLNGYVIKQEKLNQGKLHIDTADWMSGLYLLRIRSGELEVVYKITKL